MPKQIQNSTLAQPAQTKSVIAKAFKSKQIPKRKVAKKLTPSTRLQVKTRENNINAASVYKTEEILPLTAVVAKLREANTPFTVCFNCKVKEQAVIEKLGSLNYEALKNMCDVKALAQVIMKGRERTIIGKRSEYEDSMGRSLIINLETSGYASVDHRTIQYLIVDGTKFTVRQ